MGRGDLTPVQGRGVVRGALSEPRPHGPLWLAGGKDAAGGPTRKWGTGVLERGKPSLMSPTWWPRPVLLKYRLLWGARVGLLLCPTLWLREFGRAWWLR